MAEKTTWVFTPICSRPSSNAGAVEGYTQRNRSADQETQPSFPTVVRCPRRLVRSPEIDLLAAAGVSVVHNPASNLKLGSGIAPVAEMKRRGVNVALGTDGGDTSDTYSIFDQMRLAAFLSRVNTTKADDWVTAADALRMANHQWRKCHPRMERKNREH